MSGQLRALRNRIRSVENTKKITRAMEMVAAAKLRRFQDMMARSRPFTAGLETLLKRVSRPEFAGLHPFIEQREEKKTALVLITSDTGLCGSYNTDLMNTAQQFVRGQKSNPLLVAVGKSGITAFKNSGLSLRASFTDLRASRIEAIITELRDELEKIYLSKEADAIYVVYSHFKTLTSYKAVTEKLLPLNAGATLPSVIPAKAGIQKDPPVRPEDDINSIDYIFEPAPEAVFKKLIPFYFEAKIRTVFLEAIVSEQIARMTAMSQATKNAKEMIDSLVLKRNKARQAAITKEIIEIVSGSQALKLK